MGARGKRKAFSKRLWKTPLHVCTCSQPFPKRLSRPEFPAFSTIAAASIGHALQHKSDPPKRQENLLFHDYGWRRAEFDAYGFELEASDDERAAKMEEGLTIIKGMLREERFSFDGRFYKVEDTLCAPKPVQKPLPPIWMGEANNPVMVKAIAKHADMFNSMPASVEGFRQKVETISSACDAIGRDMSTMGLSLETQILLCRTDAEIDACFEWIKTLTLTLPPAERSDEDILAQMKATNPALENYSSRGDFEKEFLIGTPDVGTEGRR